MRLLFVGTNPTGGGTEVHFLTLATALADAGHEIVAAVSPDGFLHQALSADARIRLHPARFRVRNDVGASRDLFRLGRAVRPDWIVGAFKEEYWPLAVVARLLRVPAVLFSHLDQRLAPLMARALPRVVHRLVVPSEYQRRRLVDRGVPASRVALLPNPLDTQRFRPGPDARAGVRAALGLTDDDVLVGYAGRMDRSKGTDVLAAALARAMDARPNVHALWVGSGPMEAPLHAAVHATAHAARHHWQPWSPNVAPWMQAMDVLALPSVQPETFGRVLIEAQACGVAVLGSALGGIPEAMADGETGLLVPHGDVEAWTRALLALADDPAARARMGALGRAFVTARFDQPAIAAAFERLLGGA